jgi:dihydropyrimidinase
MTQTQDRARATLEQIGRVEAVVRGGHVVTADREGPFDVGIANGRIVAIGEPGSVSAEDVHDASGCVVIPGGIDPHTHVAWPLADGTKSGDDFASASALAAAWGTTTIVDFVPGAPGSLLAAAERRLEQASSSVIDFSLHPVVTAFTEQTASEVRRLVADGLATFKVYTTYESRMGSADLRRFIQVAHDAGGLPGFHAEHHDLLTDALEWTRKNSSTRITSFPASRPDHTESASIRELTGYAAEFGSALYIYHVSGMAALDQIEEARSEGLDVRAETCAHYLVYDDSVYERKDGWKFVITPPIRTSYDREGLWKAIRGRRLNAVASDHCGYRRTNKAAGVDDFTAMEPGAPGIASRMAMLWHYGVSSGRLSLRDFVDINSTRPAEALGLVGKGRIDLGADADIVVWDPHAEWVWDPQKPRTNNGSDYDIYEGTSGRGMPRTVMSRGRIVSGKAAVPMGRGQFVPQRIR